MIVGAFIVGAFLGALVGVTIAAAAAAAGNADAADVDPGLARAIAGHVAVGLARHAEDTDDDFHAQVSLAAKRARLSLNGIRVLLSNATNDGPTLDTLAVADALGYREDGDAKVLELRPERTER